MSNEIEKCIDCQCNCTPVSKACIVRFTSLTDIKLIKSEHLTNANSDIDDLIGVVCSNELCEALAKAVEDANAANEGVADPELIQSFESFLADKWLNIIQNKYFKKWYSERVLFHWLDGSSITQIKSVGLITASNTDDYKNGFNHADEKQRARLAEGAKRRASEGKYRFDQIYWCGNKHLYDCYKNYHHGCSHCHQGCCNTHSYFVDEFGTVYDFDYRVHPHHGNQTQIGGEIDWDVI